MTTSAVHPVDEFLPPPKLFALGLQHVLVMYAGAVAVPLIVGRALKLDPADVAFLISADLFVCGIATKGLVKSGAVYEPVAYNDAGVYNFFYLDFRRVLEPFSIGQFNESIIVSGASVLNVTDVQQAYTENPYIPITTALDMYGAVLTDTVCSKGVLSLGVTDG